MTIVNQLPPELLDGMEHFFTLSSVGSDDWRLQRIKYTT